MQNVLELLALPITERIPAHFGCAGIYSICHSLSGRIYVGSSKDIRGRIYMHLGALVAKKHHSRYLQNAWNKYGQGAFTIAVLERTLVENLVEREQFWIERYDSYEKGFNARPKAESMRGVEWSKAQNEARRRSNLQAWSSAALRKKLSIKFKGERRGKWTSDSHTKVSATLKQRHAENPEWRRKAQEWLHSPKNEAKRISALRRAVKRPEVYASLLRRVREAARNPARITELRLAYFEKFNRKALGFKGPDEMDEACVKLYLEGKSCREIGRLFRIDHHAISSRLRRRGVDLRKGKPLNKV